MGARFDRLRCEVFQNLFLSPMNTGFVRPAVATVPTVYGIETCFKQTLSSRFRLDVATVPTVYGIETCHKCKYNTKGNWLQQYLPFTVLKPTVTSLAVALPVSCNSTYRLRY